MIHATKPSPGGVVNLVTKKPLTEPYYSIEASAGSYNFYRGALDFSGPLNVDKTLLYRLNAAAQTTESFLDFYDEQQYIIAPTISWQISDRTQFTLAAEYIERDKDNGQAGLPPVGTVLPNPNGRIPRNRNIAWPDPARANLRKFQVGYDLEHRFTENWQLRSAFKFAQLRVDRELIFSTGLQDDNRTVNRRYNENPQEQDVYNFDIYSVGKFQTGSIEHELVTGFNYLWQENADLGGGGPASPLDVFNPNYSQPVKVGPRDVPFDFISQIETFGFYIQDQLNLAENLKLVLGGRFDIAKQKSEDIPGGITESVQQEAFSPRVGIVYQPIQPISLYASYSRSFTPVIGTTRDGQLFQPQRGTQYEVGIKADLNDSFSATLAFFDLTRSNVTTSDPVNPNFSIQTGEQRSRGIELDLSGEILPGWNIIAGYAFTDAIISKDNNLPVGDQLNNVPKHSASLWTTYEIQSRSLKGLGFGVGLFYVGDRQGTLPNTFELPSYLRTDATIFYKRDRFRAALNFKNLFDISYFDSALNRNNVFPGEPFVVQGTVSFQF